MEAAPTLDAAPYQTVMESHVVHQDAAHYQVVMDAVLAVEAVYQVAKDVALQDAAHYQAVVDVEAAQAACQAVEAVATAYPAKTAVKKITDTNQIWDQDQSENKFQENQNTLKNVQLAQSLCNNHQEDIKILTKKQFQEEAKKLLMLNQHTLNQHTFNHNIPDLLKEEQSLNKLMMNSSIEEILPSIDVIMRQDLKREEELLNKHMRIFNKEEIQTPSDVH